ncbi:MAG: S1 RNA-binding domain-containing protein [Desulfobacterota bacterium]|nr:S1 RNA-binding domain-containing protein [Thermodesulfobacteriota bacterium]MDW8002316.1 S1 RNA-binding domain-containing protein [Deltaproteobacteria bacterium]
MDEIRQMVESVSKVRLEIGEKYTVRVTGRTKEFVYVDYGDKKEGLIKIEEFLNENGEVSVREDETLEAYYAGQVSGFKLFTILREGVSTIDLQRIKKAYETNTKVEGKVFGKMKGGFEVHVGTVKCFCPHSQMGEKDENFEDFIGRVLEFKVLSLEEDGINVVLSRKELLREKREKLKEELKDVLKENSRVKGKVKSIKENGLVVDIGGLDGFIPKSEISWSNVKNLHELFSNGEVLEVAVKEVDWESEKIILSIKELIPDPFVEFQEKYGIGDLVSGTVAKVEENGILVRLDREIFGFAPLSKLSKKRRIKDPKEFFKEGQILKVRILDVDRAKRRIFLAVEEEEEIAYPHVGRIIECQVVKALQRGLLVETEEGILGYVPEGELSLKGEKAKSKHYLPGTKMRAAVINVEKERLVLSEKKVKDFEEKEAYLEYKERMEKMNQGFLRLGDLIRDKLE